MTSNYERISRENTKKYGTDDFGARLLAGLYSERTHFIYELLQNAEDARATTVRFKLFADRLEMVHDGRLFNKKDVKGICGLGTGTKSDDLTMIGKFGIGFKSVFALSLTPEIHSGDEHFRIERYVHPVAVAPRDVNDGETLFIFPFDREDVDPSTALREIGERLKLTGAETLLFLTHIREIQWEIQAGTKGAYVRENRSEPLGQRVSLIRTANEREWNSEWLVFSRPVIIQDTVGLKVEVAFLLDMDPQSGKERVVAVNHSPLVAFFATEKPTHLQFLIQGPYRTTPARDNVPKDHPDNRQLVRETAELVVDALAALKEKGLLDVSFLNNVLPYRRRAVWAAGEFEPIDIMYAPIFDRVQEAMRTLPFLPVAGGGFATAGGVKLARGGVQSMLPPEGLTDLYGHAQSLQWLSAEITYDSTPALRAFLMEDLKIEEITPEGFANRVSKAFLEHQSDAWLISFYGTLLEHEDLWRPSSYFYPPQEGPLRSKPLIRLQDGSHVTPFQNTGAPNAFLPTAKDSQYPTVKKALIEDPKAMEFLVRLGLKTPNVVSEALEHVIPRYRNGNPPSPDSQQHRDDIATLVAALKNGKPEEQQRMLNAIGGLRIVAARNPASGALTLCEAEKVYLSGTFLDDYFADYPDVWFLDEPDLPKEIAKSLGVAFHIRRVRINATLNASEKTQLRNKVGCAYDLEPEDYALEALDWHLDRITSRNPLDVPKSVIEQATIVWNSLVLTLEAYPYHQKEAFFYGTYRWFYRQKRSAVFDAHFVKQLKTAKWLPGRDGNLHRPHELALSDLASGFAPGLAPGFAPGFANNALLAMILGMKAEGLEELAKTLGLNPDDLEFLLANKERIAEFRRWIDGQA